MSPFSCPSALTAPGPFDLTAPHILPWLVWPIVVMALVTFPFGGFKTIQHFWRGVREPERRPLWWLRSLRNLCFTIGYPPWGFSVAWMDAIESWKQTLAAQGCTLQGDGLALVGPNAQDDFANWIIVGGSAISICLLLYGLLAFQERHAKLPALERRLSKAVIFAITLAMGVETILHGVGLIQGVQLTSPLPRTKNITEFALPKDQSLGEAPLEIAAGPDGNLWFTEGDTIGRLAPGK